MKYTFTLKPHEQLNAHVEYNLLVLHKKITVSFLVGLSVGIILFFNKQLIKEWDDFYAGVGIIAMVFFVFYYVIPFLITCSRLKNLKKDIHFKVADKCVSLQNADYGKKQYYSWRKLSKTRETRSFYRITFKNFTSVSIPKEMITTESLIFITSKLSRS